MADVFALTSILLGCAYLALAVVAVIEVTQEYERRGVSRFGLAYVAMAISCGPHHLINGVEAWQGFNAHWTVVAALALGIAPGVTFVGLRIEAMVGGRGDRSIVGTPAWIVLYALGFLVAAGGLTVAAAVSGPPGGGVRWLALAPNLFVTVTYALVGVLLVRTQVLHRAGASGWSLSGLALSAIFPTCAVMHLTFALTAQEDLQICPADLVGIPASVYFLWVVHRIHQQALTDWNRRPIVGSSGSTPRPAPWDLRAAPTRPLIGERAS